MPLALTGSLTAVQFCYPAELPLTLNKLKCFETGSLDQTDHLPALIGEQGHDPGNGGTINNADHHPLK